MNMEFQASLQQYTMEIGNELADLENMNPSLIIGKLQSITNSGMQQYIIQTIRTCIQHYQRDRGLIKYAYLVDKLLKLPVWNQVIQNVIVQFFCDIFIFLLVQKCFHQLDELKILRKFWLKTIHPRHLQAMKDIILAETSIDIDQYFKADFITTLKSHYQKKLKLTPEEMNFHLPKTLKTSNIIYETKIHKNQQDQGLIDNSNYLITQQIIVPANVPTMVNPNIVNPNIHPNLIRRSVSPQPMIHMQNQPYRHPYLPVQPHDFYQPQIQSNEPFRMNVSIIQRISPPLDPRDPRMISDKRISVPQKPFIQEQEPFPLYPEKVEIINKEFKRQRLYSEETRTPNSSQYMNSQIMMQNPQQYQKRTFEMEPQPHKKVHYNDVYEFLQKQPEKIEKEQSKQNYSKILEMLRSDRMYKCKQCGKGQKSMTEYERHMSEHFEEKLQIREKRKQNVLLLNLDEWTKNRSGSSLQQFNQFYISISNLTSSQQNLSSSILYSAIQPLQYSCNLCNEPFELKFLEDQWVLNNATYCEIDGVKLPLHKSCQQALDDTSNSSF